MNNRITTNQSLENTIKALAYSNQKLSDTMSAFRTMIQENHLTHLPTKPMLPINEYYEFEGLLINGNFYLINYGVDITRLSYRYPEYNLEIKLISMCPENEIQGEYKVISKMETTLYEQILTAVHQEFEDRHLDELVQDEMELKRELQENVE